MTSTTLAAAAFGADPGRWPLPAATSATELWWRAVAAGGQGRYAAARADLAALRRLRPEAGLVSLASSTQASFLRQLGWHRLARGLDGAALARAGGDPEPRIDALVGLAADALGLGRLAAAGALLERAADAHTCTRNPPPRLAIRLAWVRAELAMASGVGAEARRQAEHAVELAAAAAPGLRRHRVKSDMVLAAALCCAGDLPASRRLAETVLADTAALGLAPLGWAVACLLADIGSPDRDPAEIAEIRDRHAAFITRHGGLLHRR